MQRIARELYRSPLHGLDYLDFLDKLCINTVTPDPAQRSF